MALLVLAVDVACMHATADPAPQQPASNATKAPPTQTTAASPRSSVIPTSVHLRPVPLTTVGDSAERQRRQLVKSAVSVTCTGTKAEAAIRARKLTAAIKRLDREDTISTSAIYALKALSDLFSDATRPQPTGPTDTELAEAARADSKLPSTDPRTPAAVTRRFSDARTATLAAANNELDGLKSQVRTSLSANLPAYALTGPAKKKVIDTRLLDTALTMCLSPDELRPLVLVGADVLQGLGWTVHGTHRETTADYRPLSESTQLFYYSMGRKLCSPDGRRLMPETCGLIADQASALQIPFSLLGSAVDADLVSLPFRIVASSESVSALAVLQDLLTGVRRGDSPIMLLAGMATVDVLAGECSKAHQPSETSDADSHALACALLSIGLLTSVSADVTGTHRSSGAAAFERELDDIVNDLHAKAPELCQEGAFCFVPDSDRDDDINVFLRALNHLQAVTAPPVQPNGAPSNDRLQEAADVLFALINTLDAGIDVYAPRLKEPPPFEKSLNASWDVVRRAFLSASFALRGAYPDSVRETMKFVREPKEPTARPDGPALLRLRASVAAAKTASFDAPAYLPLLADIAAAKTASEVLLALDNAAEPRVSYRSKQDHTVGSLTALAGASLGVESPLSAGGRIGQGYGGLLGAVGVDVSGPIPSSQFNWGVMVSLLDVGSVVSSPLGSGQTLLDSGLVTSKAKSGGSFDVVELFCPGLYLRVGVPSSPFTFGIGTYFAPLGRQYLDYNTQTGATIQTARLTMVRSQLFFGADFTLMPLL